MDKSIWQRFFVALLLLIVTVVSIEWLLNSKLNNNTGKKDIPVGILTPISVQPSEFPDYDNLASLKPVEIIKEVISNATNIKDPNLTKKLEIRGNFSRIYLYLELSVDNKPLTDWDSIYVKFNNIGGHLFRPDTLKVPSDNKTTRLLYNTSYIPYLSNLPYSETRTPLNTDWFNNTFNGNSGSKTIRNINFNSLFSTTENGTIHLIALYYSCALDTPDCYIVKL